MESDSLTITPPQLRRRLPILPHLRELSCCFEAFHLVLVLSCTFFSLATCGPCLTDGLQKSTDYDACGSYVDDHGVLGYATGSSMAQMSVDSFCTNSHSFCFPSTLPGFSEVALGAAKSQSDGPLDVEPHKSGGPVGIKNQSSNYGIFELLNGRTISCSLNVKEGVDELSSTQKDGFAQNDFCSCKGPLLSQKSSDFMPRMNSEVTRYSSVHVSPSAHVKLSPPILDWGRKHLYFPSVAFLTVVNTCNDSSLHVYEPFSTNIQFYPCNFSEVLLGPGEVASICFVFLPRWLGSSSAHLILQTSSGGFLVHVKGYAVDPPYEISPLVSLGVPLNGRLSKNLSLFNPFDETVYVKEVSVWILVSQGNISHHTKATCSVDKLLDSGELGLLTVKDWLVANSGKVGNSPMAIRPHENWEIGPRSGETVIEIDFSHDSDGKIYGAFCMELLRSSQDMSDTIIVPLDNLDGKVANDGITSSVSFSLKDLISSDGKTVVAISLRNGAPHVLSVINISELAVKSLFQIKYIEGLLLFPGTVTQVAIITCSQLLFDSPPDISNENKDCKLVILTNDSRSPHIEIPCQDVIHICFRNPMASYIGDDHQYEGAESGNQRMESSKSDTKSPLQIKKALETAEADEFILANWKRQGTSRSMSVLDDHEVVFPMVQVGTRHSKWITVRNPSELPVVMQLILHSGEIIDDCRGTDEIMHSISSGGFVPTEFITPATYGFSMAESALTEAFVHPYGKASFGPIFFHPSNRCGWRSSALIRNNLSGVEWLSLRGFGGSLSLLLLEGSKPVQSIDFNIGLPISLNISPPDLFLHMEDIISACSQSMSKELYAKNTGDLPVEVKSIEVSGTECGLDGFKVHTCKGFSLEPGESTRLLISYQADFSEAIVHRDLELALAGGIFVIPMKASLPLDMFKLCKKSVYWMQLKKFLAAVLAAFLMLLIFCSVFPQLAFGFQDYHCKGGRSPITTVRSEGKASRMAREQNNDKFPVTTEVESLSRTAEEEKTLKQDSQSVARCPDDQNGVLQRQGPPIQNVIPTLGSHEQITILSHDQMNKAVPSSLSNSVVDSDLVEASQICKLTVRTGKEKGRRRRKRKVTPAGLALFEVSSSQSGNSTPSSPLSPTSATPSRMQSPSLAVEPIEARNPFTMADDQQIEKVELSEPASKEMVLDEVSLKYCSNNCFPVEQGQHSVSRTTSKPVLLPSATFPGAGSAASNLRYSSPSPGTTSPIAPHARAPGPKHYNQKTTDEEEKVRDAYTYDIWGNDFSVLNLMGSSKDVTSMKTFATENNSNSFFVRGPQALSANSHPKSVSCFQPEG